MKETKKSSKGLIVLIIILIICILSLGGYIVYDKVLNKNKQITSTNNNTTPSAKKEANINHKLCTNYFVFDNKSYKYEISYENESIDLYYNIFDNNNNNILTLKGQENMIIMFNNKEDALSHDYCKQNQVNFYQISSDDKYKYISVQLKEEETNIIYKVFSIDENNKYENIADLSNFGATGFKNTNTGEKVENYRILDNSIYVIVNILALEEPNEILKNKKYAVGEELKIHFNNNSYEVFKTGNISFEAISGIK